jgi:MYXO-CTERM domain-containing protein
VLVVAIVVVHVGTALWQWGGGHESLLDGLVLGRGTRFRVAVGGQYEPRLLRGEWWRLVTSVVLHGDALHLAVNVVAIGSLGRVVEPWIGSLRFGSWFFLGGISGAVLSHFTGVLQSDGASGGAFALLAAATVIAWRRRADVPDDERRLLGPVLWAFLGLNVVLSFVLPFVNAAGHVGGLFAGAVLGAAWRGTVRGGELVHAAIVLGALATIGYGWARLG